MGSLKTEQFTKPTADTTDNVVMRDVVGNKSDTVAGTSIIARIKQALARLVLPVADVNDNVTIADVIGNKEDASYLASEDVNSILAYVKAGYYHAHGTPILFPLNEAFITATSDATAWTHGAKAEIMATTDTAKAFDIHWAVLSDISENGQYNMTIWAGDAGSEVALCSVAFARTTNKAQEGSKRVQIPQQHSATRISVSISDSTSSAQTVEVALEGHLYNT